MSTSAQGIPPLHDVDIRLLRIFKAVVECRGFSASEETLGVGRSTISKHVADLEQRLSIRLCERGRSGFNVTAHGQIVYEATIELLDSIDQFRSRLALAKGRLSGVINLWVMDNTQLERGNPLAAALQMFKRRPGSATININTASPEAVEDAVFNRMANIGVTIANNDMPGLTYRAVGVEPNALYCSSDHEIARSLVEKSPDDSLLGRCDFATRGYLRTAPMIRGRHWTSSAVAFHVDATLQLILSGQYVGILPVHIAQPWLDSGQILKLPMPEAEATTTISLAFRTKTRGLPVITAMAEDISEAYRLARQKG